jgi:hypothetical protein
VKATLFWTFTAVKKIQKLLYLLVALVVALALLGFSSATINLIANVFVKYVLIGAVTSFATGTMVERTTGDTLKRVSLTVGFNGFGFSISMFAAAVLIIKFIIFR